MSCEIKSIATLADTRDIKDVLFAESSDKLDRTQNNDLPLQDCCISLSSAGDVLAMAYNRKIVILTSNWDSEEPTETKNKFHITWSGEIAKEQNEWITSVICLPVISLGKVSVNSGPDWTCIAVGSNTGFIKFYTDTGALLLEEQLHNESIVGIKCQSCCPPRHVGDTGLSEELHVIYSSAVCILQGFSLFSTLRTCRNHLARVRANCNDLPPVTNLVRKKWGFRNQDVTNDAEVVGSTTVNSFDHFVTASVCGGYNAVYRSSVPRHNLVVATGKRPFIGFHYALEGSTAQVLSDVAIAMASKLASAIGSAVPWFRGNTKASPSLETVKVTTDEPAEAMTCRFGLSDITREGNCIVSSPTKSLSVISDAMGRVVLLDNKRGIAVRMWKGYRNAQCGWIEVQEERHRGTHKGHSKHSLSSHLRTTLFLVIYAPKKGVIDIWGIRQGPKITTFTASKSGRLLYINYGLLGMNDRAVLRKNNARYSCVFMDPLGGLKEILVPFHFALSSKNGTRARDIHLLRKLRTFLREEEFDDEKLVARVADTCLDIKTNEIKMQTIEMLTNSKNITPNALLAAVDCFAKKKEEYEDAATDPTTKALIQATNQLRRLIKFYSYINSRFNSPPQYDTITATEAPNAKSLSSLLLTSEREVHRVLKMFATLHELKYPDVKSESKVKFKESGRAFFEFLNCFELGTPSPVGLRKQITLEKKQQASQLICHGWMYSKDTIGVWKEAAKDSGIQPFDLMQFALIYWIYKKHSECLEKELKRFTQMLHAVCSLPNAGEICRGDNDISTWWKDVRNILSDSIYPFNALTAALACRAVGMTLERYSEKIQNDEPQDDNGNEPEDPNNGNNVENAEGTEGTDVKATPDDETRSTSSTSEWENVSKDTCQFTLLVANLEDVTILNAIISQRPPSDRTTQFFSLPFDKSDVSLSIIISKGKGSVSEIVAKWLSSTGVDPARYIDTADVEFDRNESSVESLKITGPSDEASGIDRSPQDRIKFVPTPVELASEAKVDSSARSWILDKLSLLKRHFPYSLTSSVLLANLCWEFSMAWNKDVSQLEALEAALAVLRHIPMRHARHGVCSLLWRLHLKKRMEAAAKLMNKLGKLPKERLCVQDIGLSDAQLTVFLQHCVTFLEIFIDADILETDKATVIKSEELWEGQAYGPQPFAALAISQTPASYELISLHLQVANVLHTMARFNLKVSKPLNNLFDSVAQPYLFRDIVDKAILTWYRDDKRDRLRTEFLCHVITASMEFIHQETTDGKTLNTTQAILWMNKCQTLASIWKINNDELRIHQVCQLYINGFDRLAEEIGGAVNDIEKLAVNLLPIAGRRIMARVSKSANVLEKHSQMSPALTLYLETLNAPELVCTDCSNDDTIELIRTIVRYLPERHRYAHLAQMMLDAKVIFADDT